VNKVVTSAEMAAQVMLLVSWYTEKDEEYVDNVNIELQSASNVILWT